MYRVSAIVCHHKGRLIDQAVATLLASKNVELQLIIATSDSSYFNSNKDRTDIRVIFCTGGPAYKRNIAFRFAEYKLIAFFDDDIEATCFAIEEMAKELEHDKVGMVYGKILNMEYRNRFDEAGSFLTWTGFLWARAESGIEDKGQFDNVCPVLAGKSASCMIHRKVFVDAGMFDASYEILGEETDLSWRVWLLGYRVHYFPSSLIYHAFNTRFKPNDFYVPKRVYFNGCRNYLSMLLTNLEAANLIIPIILQVSVWTVAAIGMFLTGKHEAGKYIMQGLIHVATQLSAILEKRKKVQAMRTVSDRELLPLISMNPPASYFIKRLLNYISTGRHG